MNDNIERICPNCAHFYEHGKTEWEDAPECEECSHRGGFVDVWKPKDINTTIRI